MPQTLATEVPSEARGQRLDRFVSAWLTDDFPELSRARVQRLIDAGAITLDGMTQRSSHKLRGGEQLSCTVPDPEPIELRPEAMDLNVLFEDEHLIVVNKPPGLVVHPGPGHPTGTLVHGLLHHCQDLSGIGGALRPGIVHRLDRGTSGAMVVAKSDWAHEGLAQQFADRVVRKIYTAYVLGTPEPERGTLDTFYGRHRVHRRRYTGKLTSGKRAVTHYEVRAQGCGLSRLWIRLETGRTHQIRVHLSEAGWPIVGDQDYGSRRLGRVHVSIREAVGGLGHQALHAASLEFQHPVEDRPMRFKADLPSDLGFLETALEE